MRFGAGILRRVLQEAGGVDQDARGDRGDQHQRDEHDEGADSHLTTVGVWINIDHYSVLVVQQVNGVIIQIVRHFERKDRLTAARCNKCQLNLFTRTRGIEVTGEEIKRRAVLFV